MNILHVNILKEYWHASFIVLTYSSNSHALQLTFVEHVNVV